MSFFLKYKATLGLFFRLICLLVLAAGGDLTTTLSAQSVRSISFGNPAESTGWVDLGVQDNRNRSEQAVHTITDATPNGEIIFWLSIDSSNNVRRDASELAVSGGQDDFIDSRGWPAASNDEWVRFELYVSGPGAADLTSLRMRELTLSFTGNDMVEFTDGIGGSALKYINEVDSVSRYGAGERLEVLDPLTLSNVGGRGDGTWALKLTARAFGAVDITSITSFRVQTLAVEYTVTVPEPANLLPASGLLLHLDAYSLIGSTDGAPLASAWPDLSGAESFADSSDRPMYLADGGGGYPAVRFDGVDDYLEVPLALGTEASVFIVFANQRSALQANYSDVLLATPGGGSQLQLSSSKNQPLVPDYPSLNAMSGIGLDHTTWLDGLDTTDVIGEMFGDRYYIGSTVYTTKPSSSSLLIGAGDQFGVNAGQNDIREIIIYETALSDSERREVEAYLAEKYRIGIRRQSLDHPVEAYPHIAGSQQFGTQYSFGESGIRGVDYAHAILRQGSRVAKFRLSNRYHSDDGFTEDPNIDSLTELVRDQPEIKEILDLPFTEYLFWVSSFSVPNWDNNINATGLNPVKRDEIYDEVYDLAVYLLETYSGTGKTFYIGNWEGDWKFAGQGTIQGADPTIVPANRIQAMIDWANARQKAVNDAKAATTSSDVDVWFYLEANRMDWTREGLPSVVNSIVPAMDQKLDLLSFSAYSLHKDRNLTASLESMHSDLDILQAAIDANDDSEVTGSRLMIGEYGYIYNSSTYEDLEAFAWEHALTLRNFLSWQGGTLRYILQWQFYNADESSPGVSKEMCHIDDQGAPTPLYYLHENLFRRMRDWVDDYYTANGMLPSARAYSDEALLQLDTTIVQAYDPDVSPIPAQLDLTLADVSIPETVAGTNQQAVQGSVTDRYGRPMLLDFIDWAILPTQQGLTIDGSGIVSVQGNASPEAYTVFAGSSAFPDLSAELNFRARLPVASIYDKFVDFSKSVGVNPELSIGSDNAELRFEGDADRLRRTSAVSAQAITWNVAELNRFHAKVFHFGALGSNVAIEMSTDGVAWQAVALRVDPPTETNNGWNRSWVAPLNPLPLGIHYLRLILQHPTQTWNPQIGEVILFGAATGFDFWKEQSFPNPSDQANALISGPAADPTQSGVSNLYRYFADLSPDADAWSSLPQMENIAGQLYYTLPFDPTKLDVRAQVKGSLDLQSWDYTLFDSINDTALLNNSWLWLNADTLPASDAKFFKLELSL
jgi:hypothetical protein